MKKKVVSCFLVVAFSISLCAPVFATEKASLSSCFDSSVSLSAQEEVMEGLSLTKIIGFGEEFLTRVSVVDEQLTYLFNVNGIETVITPEQTEDSVIFKITDGTKKDTLEVCNNGEVIVNGHFVTTTVKKASPMEPTRIVNDYWTEVCPYGSPYDYNTYYGYDEDADVDFGQNLMSISLGTLAGLLILKIPAFVALAMTTAMDLGLWMQEKSPMETAASYKDHIYLHDEKGWWVSTGLDPLAVRKHSVTLYSRPDFAGSPTYVVTYECRELE